MKRDSRIYFFVDEINSKFPGFSKIVENILKYVPKSKIIHELDDIEPDEIIVPMGIVCSYNLLKKKHATSIAFIIDSPTLAMTGALKFYFSKGEILSKRTLIYLLKWIKYSFIELRVIRNYKRIIVVSDHDKDYLEKKYKIKKTEVISNGVDLPELEPTPPKNFRYAIGVLSFWGSGGIDDIDWFVKNYLPRLRRKYPELKFITAGKGATSDVIKYFEEHKINYLGELNDLNEFFCKIDILISTKRQECGILNRILDAFAYKKIVLGYQPNLLAFSDLRNAYFTFSNFDEFIEHFEFIKANSDEVIWMTENAYSYVKQNNSWQHNYKKLYNLIESNY